MPVASNERVAEHPVREHVRLSAGVLAVLVCAVALTGCDRTGRGPAVSAAARTTLSTSAGPGAAIPLPGRTLLAAQPKPDCEFRAAEPGTGEPKSVEAKSVEAK